MVEQFSCQAAQTQTVNSYKLFTNVTRVPQVKVHTEVLHTHFSCHFQDGPTMHAPSCKPQQFIINLSRWVEENYLVII